MFIYFSETHYRSKPPWLCTKCLCISKQWEHQKRRRLEDEFSTSSYTSENTKGVTSTEIGNNVILENEPDVQIYTAEPYIESTPVPNTQAQLPNLETILSVQEQEFKKVLQAQHTFWQWKENVFSRNGLFAKRKRWLEGWTLKTSTYSRDIVTKDGEVVYWPPELRCFPAPT